MVSPPTYEAAPVAGLPAGTLIACEDGDVAVEAISAGDIVNTLSDGPQVVRWVGRIKSEAGLVEIKAGALGENTPCQDLCVAPLQHVVIAGWQAEVLFGETQVLVAAEALINNQSIARLAAPKAQPLYYVLFDKHEAIRANGAATESYYPSALAQKPLAKDQLAALYAAVPELSTLDPNQPFSHVYPAISAAEAALLQQS